MNAIDDHSLLIALVFNVSAPPALYTLSLHDALPISASRRWWRTRRPTATPCRCGSPRSEEHTSELQSLRHLVCRLLLEKKKNRRLLIALAAGLFLHQSIEAQPPDAATRRRIKFEVTG